MAAPSFNNPPGLLQIAQVLSLWSLIFIISKMCLNNVQPFWRRWHYKSKIQAGLFSWYRSSFEAMGSSDPNANWGFSFSKVMFFPREEDMDSTWMSTGDLNLQKDCNQPTFVLCVYVWERHHVCLKSMGIQTQLHVHYHMEYTETDTCIHLCGYLWHLYLLM